MEQRLCGKNGDGNKPFNIFLFKECHIRSRAVAGSFPPFELHVLTTTADCQLLGVLPDCVNLPR